MKTTIYIKGGPYFSGCLSQFGLILAALCGVVLIGVGINTEYYSGAMIFLVVCILVMAAIGANLFLGYEGIEFDINSRKFRRYVRRLGMRSGDWKSLDEYNLLCLSAQYNSAGRGSQKHKMYELNIAREDGDAVMIKEIPNYTKAREMFDSLLQELSIEGRDFYKEHVEKQKLKPRR